MQYPCKSCSGFFWVDKDKFNARLRQLELRHETKKAAEFVEWEQQRAARHLQQYHHQRQAEKNNTMQWVFNQY
jgi:hypothetical protein